jgi:allantoin racemase
MRRILYISAIGCDSYDREIAAYLQSAAAGSLVEATSLKNARRYGHSERLASFRTVDMGVLDFQTKKALSEERILEEARRAVDEDGAEVVILGCTKEFGFYRKIQDALGVPVIDSMLAAFKQAEYLAELRCRLGWAPSKVGAYETPPVEEIAEWGLDAASDMKGLWRAGDTSRPGG